MKCKRAVPSLAILTVVFCATLALAGGCSLGYRNMHPDEDSAIYSPLFNDIITRFDEPQWLWTRGTIGGDFDSDKKAEEEAVIATIQSGDKRNPNPIEKAYLVISKIDQDKNRTAIARTLIFDSGAIPRSQPAVNNAHLSEASPMTHVRAQLVPDKQGLGDSIIVYLWGDEQPANVWFRGFKLENSNLVQVLDMTMCQTTPGFALANLQIGTGPKAKNFQLIFPSAALPDNVISKMEDDFKPPLWGNVFALDADGIYRQADEQFGEHYVRIENEWNQAYLNALLVHNLDAADLAWFEFHLGLLNHFTGKDTIAKSFLDKAKKNADNIRLSTAITEALRLLDGAINR